MVTETIQLPPELDALIRSAAERTGKAKHALMLEALQRGLGTLSDGGESTRQHRPKLKSIGIIRDSDLQSTDIEAYLAANWRPEEDWGRE